MRRANYILFSFCFFLASTPLFAVSGAPEVTNSASLAITATNDRGESVTEIPLERLNERSDRAGHDLLFKPILPKDLTGYTSWAFEASDPETASQYQMIFEGPVPSVIHWDGVFSNNNEIKTNQKYYIRLLLLWNEKKIVASPWTFFLTVRQQTKAQKNTSDAISLYVLPTGGFYYLSVQSQTQSARLLPSFYGDLRLIYRDHHTFGVKFESTCNTLFGYSFSPTAFVFSDFALFYRTHLIGMPTRSPTPSMVLSNSGYHLKASGASDAFGKPLNLEVGGKVFSTILRGFPGGSIDQELAQSAQGLALTVNLEKSLGPFRAHGGLDVGYSVLKGQMLVANAEAALTFQRLYSLEPGLQARYAIFSGTSGSDDINSNHSVSNRLLFLGLILYFKI